MTTNVPQPTFGDTGFIVPSAAAILEGVLKDINSAFGGNLNTALDTPQGQIASSETAVIEDVNATFLYYTQQVDPAYASGRMQDAIGRIYFIERNPSQPTTVSCVCTGIAGVTIPVNALAIAADGNQYRCTQSGVISGAGNVTLSFACVETGPIACPANTLNQIYQAIPGWDSINNPTAGVPGTVVESREAFEERRGLSVAKNSIGSLPSVLGAVLDIDNVLDAYVTENTQTTAQTIGGVLLNAKSLYVAVLGGNASDIARAIWSKKAPGCGYNGNTTVTVYDTSTGYVPPYPAYQVSFQVPISLAIVMDVTINNTVLVPANAEELVQNAIVAAFAGEDGQPRVKIGTELFASRFYAAIAALGSWAQIISIKIGSINNTSAQFTASVSGSVLTVTAVASGTLAVGQRILDASGNIPAGTKITALGTGAGGTGTYTLNITATVGSETMYGVVPNRDQIDVRIDQIPVATAANIKVVLA